MHNCILSELIYFYCVLCSITIDFGWYKVVDQLAQLTQHITCCETTCYVRQELVAKHVQAEVEDVSVQALHVCDKNISVAVAFFVIQALL